MSRPFLVLVTAALVLASAPAGARVPEKTPRRLLEASVRRTLNDKPVRGSRAGLIVMRGPRQLVGINAAQPLQPASLLKLATTITAMERFGPEHRFHTRVVAATRPVQGTLAGSLVLVGGGDPTLATRAYRAERFIGKPKPDDPHPIPAFASGSPTVEDLAAALVRAGVRRVAGDLVVDGSIFDAVRTQPGWIPDYLGNDPEVGYLDGLTINEGFTSPEAKGLLPSPSLAAGQALKAALAARGAAVSGRVRAGRAPARSVELANVSSPPMTELIFYTNRWSINTSAEYLLKNLGAAFGSGGTSPAGAAIVRETLATLRIGLTGFDQIDGSGLSLLNRMAPETIAAILVRILEMPGEAGDAMRESLPVAAGPGTLFKRLRGTIAAGNLRGKTGTIKRVRALAGWVTSLDGVPVVYVMVFNNVPRPSQLTNPLDLLGLSLARYPLG